MRSIEHPGPVAPQRVQVVPCAASLVDLALAPGPSLLDALTHALAPYAARSAVLRLSQGAFFPLAYAMPALSKTTEHAVYFSDRLQASGACQIETAAVTYGQRDGLPWLHCHAVWTAADGARRCGHVLPDEAVICETLRASACLLEGAQFQVRPDAETHFSLFQPESTPGRPNPVAVGRSLAVRIGPNTDLCTAIEALCAEHGIVNASIQGGVGSLVGAVFDDGCVVEPFVTEVLIRHGRVRPDAAGAPRAEIDVSLVDHTGALAQGRLRRGANPVLVTFELVLVPAAVDATTREPAAS